MTKTSEDAKYDTNGRSTEWDSVYGGMMFPTTMARSIDAILEQDACVRFEFRVMRNPSK